MGLLHNCTGKIDMYIPIINEISLGKLGQQVNVVNKPGAGGGVASMSVARAKPDG